MTKLEQLRALLKARVGPWFYHHVAGCQMPETLSLDRGHGRSRTIATAVYTGEIYAAELKLAAAAVNALPDLLDAVEAAQTFLLAHETRWEKAGRDCAVPAKALHAAIDKLEAP